MRLAFPLLSTMLLCGVFATAQQTSSGSVGTKSSPAGAAALSPSVVDSIEVRTTVEPLPLSESNRSVEVMVPREVPAFVDSAVDLLRSDASLNLQARGPEGVQADLSIR